LGGGSLGGGPFSKGVFILRNHRQGEGRRFEKGCQPRMGEVDAKEGFTGVLSQAHQKIKENGQEKEKGGGEVSPLVGGGS